MFVSWGYRLRKRVFRALRLPLWLFFGAVVHMSFLVNCS